MSTAIDWPCFVSFGKLWVAECARWGREVQPFEKENRVIYSIPYIETVCRAALADPGVDPEDREDVSIERARRALREMEAISDEEWWAFEFLPWNGVNTVLIPFIPAEQPPFPGSV